MPTYAQLQAEPWWDREIVTPEMDWLGDELCRRTGRPRSAAGTKGDNHHLRGAHRSQEWIKRSRYCTSRTYTVQGGLTAEQERCIAGFDFTPGSAAEMIAQSKRIYAAMRAGRLDEVREFYGNVNGDKIVDGWDNVDDEPASSDSSHLWHWHITIDRRHTRNRKLMERILAVALGLPLEEDEMSEQAEREIHSVYAGMFSGGSSMGRAVNAGSDKASNSLVAKLDYTMLRLDAIAATLTELTGRDFTDETAIVQGVLSGLGRQSPDEVARALVAAGQDPDALAAALLRARDAQPGVGA